MNKLYAALAVAALALASLFTINVEGADAAPTDPFTVDAFSVAYYISVAELGCYLEDCETYGARYYPIEYANGHYGTAHVTAFKVRHIVYGNCLKNVYVWGVGLGSWQSC